tara:strand:+ start:352 stop:573 length:222 start_codon:yes stop_codon:yes gene_type:complete
MITPYIESEDIAKIYKIPTFISAKTKFSDIGITLHATKDKAKETIGARINITLFALAGIMVSFENNLTPSAKG